MRQFLVILFLALIAFPVFSQVPLTINYQGVARDASGNPVTNQTIGLQFKISNPANTSFHSETQSVVTNSLGLFSTKIGAVTPLPTTGWNSLPCILNVSIDINSSGFVSLGSQTLASVPYALYTLNGNALPTATVNGTTLRYNAGINQWQSDTLLLNNGSRVSVGNRSVVQNNKFKSIADNVSDSAAIFGLHTSATDGYAGVRGFASGSSLPSSTVNATGIAGGHFVGYNFLGQGIGALGQGISSSGNGIGIVGIGSSSGTAVGSNYAIGLYGTVDLNSTAINKYAGVFDNGGVIIRDSLILGPGTNVGVAGDVLTRSSTGRARWQSMPTSTATGNGWNLNGNTGTTPGTDFLGTNDASSLIIKTNGIARIGINTSTNSISGGVVIGGNAGNTSLGRALTLQGLLSTSDASDQTYGSFAIRAGSNGNAAQGFLSFANSLGGRTGYLGDFSVGDADIYLNASNNIRLIAGTFTSNPAIYVEGATNNVGLGTTFPGAKLDINNTAVSHAILATQNNSNEAAIINNTGNGTGIYGSTGATSSATNPAIFGEAAGTSTNNAGVYGLSNTSSGVKGFSQNLNGVWGESNNNVGVFGLSTGNGQAGKFLLQGSSSANNAVYIASNSTPPALKAEAFNVGAAIEAKHSNASAGSSNAALLINDGHIKSVGAVTTLSNTATVGGFSSLTSTCTNCTDVKGSVSLSVTASSVSNGDNIIVQINFTKDYAQNPVINLTPLTDFGRMTYYVSAVAQNFFQVKIINSSGVGITPPTSYKFNYFVIE